jgi:hypothetical protein
VRTAEAARASRVRDSRLRPTTRPRRQDDGSVALVEVQRFGANASTLLADDDVGVENLEHRRALSRRPARIENRDGLVSVPGGADRSFEPRSGGEVEGHQLGHVFSLGRRQLLPF